jgi:hypothetical protein
MKVGRKSPDHDWHAIEEEFCGHSGQYQKDNNFSDIKKVDDPATLKESYCGQCEDQRRAQDVNP